MNVKKIGEILGGQDGVVLKGYIFRFGGKGNCRVYDMKGFSDNGKQEPCAEFLLDRADELMPHCNAVVFGNEFYAPEDPFPILYANIYNNYANEEDSMEGVCLAYRLIFDGSVFSSELVQIIRIGFTDDYNLWRSDAQKPDIRPYGNFVIDTDKNMYYAYVMRDKYESTRYFAFDMPKLSDGIMDSRYGVPCVILGKEDIRDYFDCPYHRYIQGGCYHDGKIYSVEGSGGDNENPPVLRIIDLDERKQILYFNFEDKDLVHEPEFIDFCDNICYYGDSKGNMYILSDMID